MEKLAKLRQADTRRLGDVGDLDLVPVLAGREIHQCVDDGIAFR